MWQSVVRELDLWQDRGLRAKFGVRDDDAHEMSPQLAQLHHFADLMHLRTDRLAADMLSISQQ